ncbi:MAG TPA: hypothetical protein DHV36_06470 [Desulfobacteraceae bacterium]|nr:hypothetical protein [Desulfobacteraceae bacterium]
MNTGLKSVPVWMLAWLTAFCIVLSAFSPALAGTTYHTRVKVIHATKGKAGVDPGLEAIAREIGSEFNYTRFRRISEKAMSLSEGQKGRITLPGNRDLIITPTGSNGSRIQYHIRINAKGNPVFQTGVRLQNGSSVTIGGPRLKKGVILINIEGRTR